MDLLKIVTGVIGLPILLFLGAYAYMDSDFVEVPRLQEQIQKDLAMHRAVDLVSIHRESYGWAEEGGDRALLQLNKADCEAVQKALSGRPVRGAPNVFSEHGIVANAYIYKHLSRSKGTSVAYTLGLPGCALWREFHYE